MTASKIVLNAASGAASDPVDVDDVFSTTIYEGTGSSLAINNGIDLSGEGGLVWSSYRSGSNAVSNWLIDSERGVGKYIRSNTTAANITTSEMSSFNSNGYTLSGGTELGYNGNSYVSWTFRKQKRFFDIVTYSGTGSNQSINHNLDSIPGMILVKKTSGAEHWAVYHRGANAGTDPEDYYLRLNSTDNNTNNTTRWQGVAPTSTQFHVGTSTNVNGNGETYIAYLFAHNNNDGEFGPDGDQDIIKCGHYTGNSTAGAEPVVNLGFEPQFVMFKATNGNPSNWVVYDAMRGYHRSPEDFSLAWDSQSAENGVTGGGNAGFLTATGFDLDSAGLTAVNDNGTNIIYMAIRRGPLAPPESSASVFNNGAVQNNTNRNLPTALTNNQSPDMVFWRNTGGSQNWYLQTRLHVTNTSLIPNLSNQQSTSYGNAFTKEMGQATADGTISVTNSYGWMWSRAPHFFDVVLYKGSGGSSQSISHNLGKIPEMIWVKSRSDSTNWAIYHTATGLNYVWNFSSGGGGTGNQYWGTAAHTSSVFKVGSDTDTGGSGRDYVAWLFATVDGVSKVGSYTGNGSTQTIDCGFTNGAKLVIIKSTSSNWNIWDSVRGIVSGNDPRLQLDNNNATKDDEDFIDPHSSGFSLFNQGDTNQNGTQYIFYAVAA